MNAVLEIGSSVDRVICEKGTADWRVWSQLEHKSTDYMSANYGVKQKTNLTQLGIEKALDNQFIVGGILSQSHSNNEFDFLTSGEGDITMLSLW